MPGLATLMNVLLGYGARQEARGGPRYRRPDVTLAYGDHPLQRCDLHLHPAARCAPLLVFVHGGAWQFGDKARRLKDRKAAFAHGEGAHFACLNFRLFPEVGPQRMAQDVAAALALLRAEARALGVDASRIVLMGHSSGAHLAALVLADPAYLGAHGLTPAALAGVIANDGAAYDATLPSAASRLVQRRFVNPVFAGADPLALSPAWQFGRHLVPRPPLLVLHTADKASAVQALRLEDAARKAGVSVERQGFPGAGAIAHLHLSRRLGEPGFGPTEAVRRWLRRLGLSDAQA